MSPTLEAARETRPEPRARHRRHVRRRTSLFAHGEPLVWLTGGALIIALAMIAALLLAVVYSGGRTFWPLPVEEFELRDGSRCLGDVTRVETYEPGEFALTSLVEDQRGAARERVAAQGGSAERMLVRVGNKDLTGITFRWLSDYEIAARSFPEWALVVERLAWGRFYGVPTALRIGGQVAATDPAKVWELFEEYHAPSRRRFAESKALEKYDVGVLNRRLEDARLRLREVELAEGVASEAWAREHERFRRIEAEVERDFAAIQEDIAALREENARYEIVLTTADGIDQAMVLADIVRAYPANQLRSAGKAGVFFSRWAEFLGDDPRESNTEGGVFPAIIGTVAMTLVMSIVVVPFGVLAALYLREYAKQGTIISMVRIAVNNLAGVPSIVFGVFGLGFFCYIIGASIDELFYSATLPNPTFGKGGILWSSLTLALLTLPVVIVATEESLAAVPNSMREGSLACGATKWQTIRRIVLPRAAPGIMTGMILAIARGAGEVAPLMLVGAVKLAPYLPVDLSAPFVHPSRSFMHLGFHIYDLGFQSPDSEAAKSMVFTTTLLLIAIVVLLNCVAIWIRARLRKRFLAVHI